MISDFWADLRVIQRSSAAALSSSQSYLPTRGRRASYRNIRCRSKQLTNKYPRRRQLAAGGHDADGDELPRCGINLGLAAGPCGLGGHRLPASKPRDGGGLEPRRWPTGQRGIGRQQQAVQRYRAGGRSRFERLESLHWQAIERLHAEPAQEGHVADSAGGLCEILDERPHVSALR